VCFGGGNNMIVFKSAKSVDECENAICNNIHQKKSSIAFVKPGLVSEDEIIGDFNGRKFWLQKTKPRLYNGVQREYHGEIKECDDEVVIVGNFFLPLIFKIMASSIIAIITLISFFNSKEINASITVFAILCSGYGLFYYLNLIMFAEEENIIKEFLRQVAEN
jgi:hypothetical protein